jgi:Uncharacterized conserved protein (DUF2278)
VVCTALAGTVGDVRSASRAAGDNQTRGWVTENGIWQDGATIVELSDGRLAAFLNKFSTQSDRTDQGGHSSYCRSGHSQNLGAKIRSTSWRN